MVAYIDDKKKKPPSGIDLAAAFTFVADQPHWIVRLLVLLVFGFIATTLLSGGVLAALLPLLPPEIFTEFAALYPELGVEQPVYHSGYIALIPIGLVGGLAGMIQLGYYVEIVRRVRLNVADQLPAWENWGRLLRDGGVIVGVYAVYWVALLLIGIGLLWGSLLLSGSQAAFLIMFLCGVPLILLSAGLFVIFATSIGVVRYITGGGFLSFFDWGWIWRTVREHGALTRNWFLLGVLANFGFSTAQALPVVGFVALLVSLAMQVPVQAHLLGQYAAQLEARTPYRNTYGVSQIN